MFAISRTTANYAARRGYDLHLDDTCGERMWFCPIIDGESADEPDLVYLCDGQGLTYSSAAYLPQSVKEELPAHIGDEATLRRVIDFIHNETK